MGQTTQAWPPMSSMSPSHLQARARHAGARRRRRAGWPIAYWPAHQRQLQRQLVRGQPLTGCRPCGSSGRRWHRPCPGCAPAAPCGHGSPAPGAGRAGRQQRRQGVGRPLAGRRERSRSGRVPPTSRRGAERLQGGLQACWAAGQLGAAGVAAAQMGGALWRTLTSLPPSGSSATRATRTRSAIVAASVPEAPASRVRLLGPCSITGRLRRDWTVCWNEGGAPGPLQLSCCAELGPPHAAFPRTVLAPPAPRRSSEAVHAL